MEAGHQGVPGCSYCAVERVGVEGAGNGLCETAGSCVLRIFGNWEKCGGVKWVEGKGEMGNRLNGFCTMRDISRKRVCTPSV